MARRVYVFFGFGLGPLPWPSPSPQGQKRNYLERNVETKPDRITKPQSHPGAAAAGYANARN